MFEPIWVWVGITFGICIGMLFSRRYESERTRMVIEEVKLSHKTGQYEKTGKGYMVRKEY